MSSSEPRVLMWIPLPPPVAGPEIASALLADACRRHLPGIDVENATLRTSNMAKGRFDLDGLRAFTRAYRRFVTRALESDVVYLVAAANLVGSMRDAVLIATARAMRRDVVLHLRGGRYGAFYREANPVVQWVLRRAWGSARTAIVQTPRLRNVISEAAPEVPTVVVPNGLPAHEFPPKRAYPATATRILFVGHLTYSKGFYDLIHAFRELRRKRPDVTLVCAGEKPSPERSFANFLPPGHRERYLARRHAICNEIVDFVDRGDGVEYAGIVTGEAKLRLFESADIFVLPSYAEGFSMAILEAMFHGMPVIVANAGGCPDVVRHSRNGIVVEPGDRDELGAAIETLLDRPDLRQEMGTLNAREARDMYELDAVALRLVRVLTGDRESVAPTTRGS